MTCAKKIGLGGFVVIVVVVVVLWVWGIGVDDVPSVFPDGLEATPEPSEFTLEAISSEFAEEATDIRGLGDGIGICIVDEDARAGAPGGEFGAGRGRGKHCTQLLEREQGPLEQSRGHTERDGMGDACRGVCSMGPDVDEECRRVGEPGIEVGRGHRRKRWRACRRWLSWRRGADGGEAGGEDAGRMAESIGNGLGEV
jgi:hypothetical protein